MSITSAMFTGVNGMKAQSEAMGVISNNISNVNTIGYKNARTIFSDLLSQDIGHNNSQVGLGTQIQKVESQFFGGALQTTSNISDVALQGDNLFFAVAQGTTTAGVTTPPTGAQTPATSQLTRAGAFNVDSAGYLVNASGKYVLDSAGAAITFTAAGAAAGGGAGTASATFGRITSIQTDGTISAVDSTGANMTVSGTGKIGIVRVQTPVELQKIGDSLYSGATATAGVQTAFVSAFAPTEKIVANSLESSNVDMASEMVNMIVTQRAYSANSKTITVNDQLTNDAIQMVR